MNFNRLLKVKLLKCFLQFGVRACAGECTFCLLSLHVFFCCYVLAAECHLHNDFHFELAAECHLQSSTSNVAPALLSSTSSLLTQCTIRSVDDLVAERIADKLPPFSATTTEEFMRWSFLVIKHFNLLSGLTEDILQKPIEQTSSWHSELRSN